MDEPTNHLDLRAKDVLLEALSSFTGTVVLVSHDRYFLDRLATRIFEVEGGHVHVYPGNYEDYVRRKQGLADPIAARSQEEFSNAPVGVISPAEDETALTDSKSPQLRRLNPIKLRQMQERCTFVEEEIPRLESLIAETERALGDYVSVDETRRLTQLLEDLRVQHATLSAEWEVLAMELEQQAT